MPRTQLPLCDGSYESASRPLSVQRAVNLMPVINPANTLSQKSLMMPPGITSFGSTGTGHSRGAMTMSGIPYFVNGGFLYEIDADGNETSRGAMTGSGRVSMANNGADLMIVIPGTTDAYVYTASTTTLTKVTDADYLANGSDGVQYKDGYFIHSSNDGEIFFISNLNQPLAYDALDFSAAESNPDNIVTPWVSRNELYVLGAETVETFQNIGGSGFPFQRRTGASMQIGCHARQSLVNVGERFAFVGGGQNERTGIFLVSGSSPQKISTQAIDQELQNYSEEEIADSFAMTYTHNGNSIISFTFTSSERTERTFSYNLAASEKSGSQVWFEQQTGVTDAKWRVNSIIEAFGDLLVGDSEDGRVGKLSSSNEDYGLSVIRQRTTQPYTNMGMNSFYGELELVCRTGVGLTSGQGSDPQIRLSWSDDGGRTWSSELSRSLGKIGEYTHRVIWRRLGMAHRERVLKFEISDPVEVNLYGLEGGLS